MRSTHRIAVAGVFATILAAACRDTLVPEPTVGPITGAPATLARVECVGVVATGTLVCREPSGAGGRGPALSILGQTQVKLASSEVAYDTLTALFSFNTTLQNLLTESVGTPDGTTVSGLKVYYETGPSATSYYAPGDTGTVTVNNPDGSGNFTKANQPYHLYLQLLAPQQITPKKRWELRVPRTVKTFSFTVRVFTARPSEVAVPAHAPSGTPAWFRDPANSTRCFGRDAATCLKNVVVVSFDPSATAEERQSAVDMHSGQVVGGWLSRYYVQLPAVTSVAQLESAIAGLRGLPQIEEVWKYDTSPVATDYLRPQDDAAWRAWHLDPDSADGQNWAQERIAAPMAWGCNTGSGSTSVAVVDNQLYKLPDLLPNLNLAASDSIGEAVDATPAAHGTSVAAVLAARGNNGTGVTGVMWAADLRLHRVGEGDHVEIWKAMLRAGRQGARVINISVSTIWLDTLPGGGVAVRNPALVAASDTAQRRRDEERVQATYSSFREHMDTLARESRRPLITFAAGNTNRDARWSSARLAAQAGEPYAGQVLVVGASTRQDTLGWFSSRGPLVEVLAPGERVFVLNGDGVIDSIRVDGGVTRHTGSGTSFAAPMAAGIAGLLFDFDPTLTAAEVKGLILEGARRGGRAPSGIPVVNAHQSLRAAAERPGAPLCGNRVWYHQGAMYAQRDSAGTTSGAADQLFATADDVHMPQAVHGGKRIHYGGSTLMVWRGTGSWTPEPVAPSQYDSVFELQQSPAYRAFWGESHGRDSIAYLSGAAGGGVEVRLWEAAGNTDVLLATLPEPSSHTSNDLCVRTLVQYDSAGTQTLNQCVDTVQVGSSSATTVSKLAYSPFGERLLYLTKTAFGSASASGSAYICPGQTVTENRSVTYYMCQDTEARGGMSESAVYSLPLRPGASPTRIYLAAGVELREIGMSDGRRDFLVQRRAGGHFTRTVHYWDGFQAQDRKSRNEGPIPETCVTEFRQVASPATLLQILPFCGGWEGATFSPNRVAAARVRASAGRTVPAAVREASAPRGRWLPQLVGRSGTGSHRVEAGSRSLRRSVSLRR